MGGLTGVMLAIVPFNWQAHDTAFVTAHLHYVLIGGFVFPMMAAASWWMPQITGRQRIRGLGEAAFWIILIGFHGTFFIMHLTGLLGMPRRIDVYPDNPEWIWLNLTSSVFSFVMTIGFALYAMDLVLQAWLGERAHRDPWRAPTLDWAMPLPAPSYNFASIPTRSHSQATAQGVILPLARGEGLLPGAPRGQREVIVGSASGSIPCHVAVLPGNTALPMALSAAIGAFVLLMLAGLYALTPLAMAAVAALVWRWGRDLAPPRSTALPQSVPVAPGLELPLHWSRRDTLVRMGTVCLLVANGTLFASLMFGVGFLSVVAPNWPAPVALAGGWGSALMVAAPALALLAAAVAARLADKSCTAQRDCPRMVRAGALTGVVLNGAALLALAVLALTVMDDPTRHARDALRGVLAGYVAVHALIGLGCAAYALDQTHRHEIGGNHAGIVPVWRLWQDFAAVTGVISAAVAIGQGMGA